MNPNPDQNTQPATGRNPYTLWFVILAFVAPVALAYYTFYFVNLSSFNNHGELLKPMIHVSALKLKDENNVLVPTDVLTYKWRFISILNASCDPLCKSRLLESRQVHQSLGKDRHRVLQVIVKLAESDVELAAFIKSELPDAIILMADAEIITPLMPAEMNAIYIQDPIGNIMMRFTPEQSAEYFRHDIRKLLKASQIG